jgi:uncharacterized protein YqfB (UPF0267 family)
MNLERIDVLLNVESKEEFHKGDIVKITTKEPYRREYIGRLIVISTLSLDIDISEKFISSQKKIELDRISEIKLVLN